MIDTGINYSGNDWMSAEHSTGTTIMAAECADGVVIGADSRTSTGSYVANRVTDKLTKLTDNIYCCRSGSAADTQAIADFVQYYLNYQENCTGEPPLVLDAVAEFKRFCYEYKDNLVAGIIVAGWDSKYKGQVYSIPLGGMYIRQKCTIGGSGSSYVYGLVQENFRDEMPMNECVEFVKNTVFHAMYQDGSSGGVCRIATISKDGVKRETAYAKPRPDYI